MARDKAKSEKKESQEGEGKMTKSKTTQAGKASEMASWLFQENGE